MWTNPRGLVLIPELVNFWWARFIFFLEAGERLYTSEQRSFCFAGVTKFKESYEVRFHLLHQRWINSSPGNRTFPSRLKVQAFFKKEHHNNISLMIGEFSVGLLSGTGTSRSIIRWELTRT